MHKFKKSPRTPASAASSSSGKATTPAFRHAATTTKALLCLHVLLAMMLSGVGSIVIYQVKFVAPKTGRTDYALAGESIELTSQYLMKDDVEDIKEVHWFKDGKIILEWDKHQPGIRVMDYAFKGHVDNATRFDRVLITNVTLDMHGKYKCRMRTDLTTHEQELSVVVITHTPCSLRDWGFSSEPDSCREFLRFDCRRMFPRPVPSCGLYDSRPSGGNGGPKLIEAVPLMITEEPIYSGAHVHRGYHVEYVETFDLVHANGSVNARLANLLAYAGHLMFKCDIEISGTSWRHSLEHKMFDFRDGCEEDPLDAVRRMRAQVNALAQARLVKSNYVPGGRDFRQLEDAEMLTANMKYELFSPSKLRRLREEHKVDGDTDEELDAVLNVSQAERRRRPQRRKPISVDLNCWQKPRVGTVARLACGSSVAPVGDHTARKPVKLVGSNLLECRPGGWVPVRESEQLNNDLLSTPSSRAYVAVVHRKPRRPANATSTKTTTTTPAPAIDLTPGGGGGDSDDSLGAPPNSLTFEFGPEPLPIPTGAPPPARGSQEHIALLIEEATKLRPDPDLSPANIAKLLPTCALVTSKRRQPDKAQHRPRPESVLATGGHYRTHANQRDGKWYTASSSSAAPRSPCPPSPLWLWTPAGLRPSLAHSGSLLISLIVSLSFIVTVALV